MKSKEGGTPLYVRWEYIYKDQIREINPSYFKKFQDYFYNKKDKEFMYKREVILKNIEEQQRYRLQS